MTVVLIVAAGWMLGSALAISLAVAAKRGDRNMMIVMAEARGAVDVVAPAADTPPWVATVAAPAPHAVAAVEPVRLPAHH